MQCMHLHLLHTLLLLLQTVHMVQLQDLLTLLWSQSCQLALQLQGQTRDSTGRCAESTYLHTLLTHMCTSRLVF
jgi:hypothetical protein